MFNRLVAQPCDWLTVEREETMTGITWRSANLNDRLGDITDDARIAPDVATAELDARIEDSAGPLSEDAARRLTERIKIQARVSKDSLAKLQRLVEQARVGGAHVVLGFSSWTAYLADLFAEEPLRLAREQRQEIVGYLAGEGMSTRAIAPIVGASVGQVHADRQVFSSEHVEAQPTIVVDKVTGEVLDAPDPRPVTGLDGKQYERPVSAPKVAPAGPSLASVVRDLGRAVERLEGLVAADSWVGLEGDVWVTVAGLRDRLSAVIG